MSLPPTKYEDFSTISDVIRMAALEYGGKVALRQLGKGDEYKNVTYAQLLSRVNKAAQKLSDCGLGSGCHIAIMGNNSPEWVIGSFAVLTIGAVLVPIDVKSTKEEAEFICQAAHAKALLVDHSVPSEWAKTVRHRFTLGDENGSSSALEEEDTEVQTEFGKGSPGDLALLVFTSGTTGTSKGVMLTHNNILSDLSSIAQRIPIKENEPVLSILPLSHMFEYTAGMIYPVSCGAPITYLRKLKGSEIIMNMQLSKTAVMIAVPRILQLLRTSIERQLDKLSWWKKGLINLLSPLTQNSRSIAKLVYSQLHERMGGHLHFLVVGGAPIHSEVIEFFHNVGLEVLQGYGLTETSPVLCANSLSNNRVGTVGPPLAQVEIKIDGPGDVPGEILVRGPMVMKGYFENQAATDSVLQKGWFKTGDLGYLDEEGALVICGRRKALIVTANGKNVYPEELEAVLGRSPLIHEICVVAQRLENGGERPYAFVVPEIEAMEGRDPKELLDKELRQLGRNLSDFKRLIGWELHESELPKTCTQKVRRFLLQERLDGASELKANELSSDGHKRGPTKGVPDNICSAK